MKLKRRWSGGVRAVKAEFDRYRELADLQFEFIEEHEELSGTLVRGKLLTAEGVRA